MDEEPRDLHVQLLATYDHANQSLYKVCKRKLAYLHVFHHSSDPIENADYPFFNVLTVYV